MAPSAGRRVGMPAAKRSGAMTSRVALEGWCLGWVPPSLKGALCFSIPFWH